MRIERIQLKPKLKKQGLYSLIQVCGFTLTSDVAWNKDSVKMLLWDVIQKAETGKTSSTKLTAGEYGDVHKRLDLIMQEKGLEHIPPPSQQSLCEEQNKDYYERGR